MTAADRLRAIVASDPSTSDALTRWCGEHGIGTPPLRSVVHIRSDADGITPAVEHRLGLRTGEPVFRRAITLTSGTVPLLDADTWFVATRLPSEVSDAIMTTDTPLPQLLGPGLVMERLRLKMPPGAPSLDTGIEVEDAEVPVLDLSSLMRLDGRIVAVCDERLRPDALGGVQAKAG